MSVQAATSRQLRATDEVMLAEHQSPQMKSGRPSQSEREDSALNEPFLFAEHGSDLLYSYDSSYSDDSGGTLRATRHHIYRYLMRLLMGISIFLFVSPLIFFVLGITIIDGFSQTDSDNDANPEAFPSVRHICRNTSDCARYIFFLVYLILTILVFFTVTILFRYRRDRHPLRSRSVPFLACFGFSALMYEMWGCIGVMYSPNWLGCEATHAFNNIFYFMMILPYWFRAYRIKVIFEQASVHYSSYQHNLSFIESDQRDVKMDTSVQQNRTYTASSTNRKNIEEYSVVSSAASGDDHFRIERALLIQKSFERNLLKNYLFCLIPFLGLSILSWVFDWRMLPTFTTNCDRSDYDRAFLTWSLIHIIEIVALVLLVYTIRHVWRAFSVKQELIWVVVLEAVFSACMVAFSVNGRELTKEKAGMCILYLVLMRTIGLFTVSITWPLYRTFFPLNLPDIPSQDVITSLRAILEDVDACTFFRQFMTEQDSHFFLNFWMEVTLFQDAAERDELDDIHNEAVMIFRKYFDANNRSRVATTIQSLIPQQILSYIEEEFRCGDDVDSEIFNEPHAIVFEHMESLYYRLFLRSQYCKQLLATLQGQEAFFRRLIKEEIL